MGSGIAQLAATNGCEVWLHDSDFVALSKARESISSRIQNLVLKGHLTKVSSILFIDESDLICHNRLVNMSLVFDFLVDDYLALQFLDSLHEIFIAILVWYMEPVKFS